MGLAVGVEAWPSKLAMAHIGIDRYCRLDRRAIGFNSFR